MRQGLSLFRYGFVIILLIIYIYSIKFYVLPFTGKVAIALFGILWFFIDLLKGYRFLTKGNLKILVAALTLMLWGFITALLNGTDEYLYVSYVVSFFSCFFSSYVIAKLLKNKLASFEDFLLLVSVAITIENFITIGIRISPPIQDFFFSIQEFQTKDSTDQDFLMLQRLVGLGEAVYFGVLSSTILGLSSCGYIFLNTTSKLRKWFSLFSYFIITVVSFLIARYTLAVVIITAFFLFLYISKRFSPSKVIKYVTLTILISIFIIQFLISILPDDMYIWALAPILEHQDTQTMGQLEEWWYNTSFSIKTFFIGDGLYTMPNGLYYMQTDVGFYRQIYYGGIIGLILMLLLHYRILKVSYSYFPTTNFKYFVVVMFLSFMAILTKGDAQLLNDFLLVLCVIEFSNVPECQCKH